MALLEDEELTDVDFTVVEEAEDWPLESDEVLFTMTPSLLLELLLLIETDLEAGCCSALLVEADDDPVVVD